MMIELNTTFTQEEKDALQGYGDVDIKRFIDSKKLFHSSIQGTVAMENPNRLIGVGGLYLVELKDEPGEWYMGQRHKGDTYHFWGCYGDLKNALEGL